MPTRPPGALVVSALLVASCTGASDVFVPDTSPLVAAAPTAFGLCVLHASGVVSCRGLGDHGELGDGSTMHVPALVELGRDLSTDWTHVRGLTDAAAIATDGWSGCAVRRGGNVVCWGMGVNALGDGAAVHETCHDPALFADPDTVDCARAPVAVAGISDATAIEVGAGATCVRRATGQLSCWGQSAVLVGSALVGTPSPADLGVDDAVDVALTAQAVCVLHATRTVSCHGFAPFLHTPIDGMVPGVSDATQLGAGGGHVCALRATGEVVCWGDGELGVLGDGTTDGHASPMPVPGLADAVEIDAAETTTCARRANGHVVCWGLDGYPDATRFGNGALGDGLANHQACTTSGGVVADCSPTPVEVAGLDDAVAIDVGGATNCARRATGDLVCWGSSASGQLGAELLATEAMPTPVVVTAD